MYELIVPKEVGEEIDALYETDEDAAAQIDFLLDELVNDQPTLEMLCVAHNNYLYNPAFEVKVFEEAKKQKKNIYILKFRLEDGNLASQRILIGFNSQRSTYYVLAVPDRSISYNTGDPAFIDLLHRYEQCGIPDYG